MEVCHLPEVPRETLCHLRKGRDGGLPPGDPRGESGFSPGFTETRQCPSVCHCGRPEHSGGAERLSQEEGRLQREWLPATPCPGVCHPQTQRTQYANILIHLL